MYETLFWDFGLSRYETKVYLALIEIGEASTGEILKTAKIHTGKIYQILESLKQKGFVSEVIKNGVKKFFPTDPNKISEYFREKRKKISEQEELFKEILPELNKKINSHKTQTHIEIYTGFEGMKKAFDKEKEYYKKRRLLCINGITDYNKHPKKFVDFFEFNMFPARERSGILIHKIIDKKAIGNIHEKNVLIKTLEYSSLITFNTIEKLVIISVWTSDPLFFVVESSEFAKGLRENFDILWKIAKK